MEELPISHNNHFVILYCSLLYSLAKLAREGRILSAGISHLSEVYEYFENNKQMIFEALDISEDINTIETEIREIIKILKTLINYVVRCSRMPTRSTPYTR